MADRKQQMTKGQEIAATLGVSLDVAGRLLQLEAKEGTSWRKLAAKAVEEFLERKGSP